MSGATTILLSFFTDFGTPGKEKRGFITLRLDTNKETIHVGDITCVSPAYEARKRGLESQRFAKEALRHWDKRARATVPTLQRWWRLQVILRPLSEQPPPAVRRGCFRMQEAFQSFGKSSISQRDMALVFRKLGWQHSESDLQLLLNSYNSSDHLDFKEFVQWLVQPLPRAPIY